MKITQSIMNTVICKKSKREVKMGDIYRHGNSFYIISLVHVDKENYYAAINLSSGSRWTDMTKNIEDCIAPVYGLKAPTFVKSGAIITIE